MTNPSWKIEVLVCKGSEDAVWTPDVQVIYCGVKMHTVQVGTYCSSAHF